MLLFSSKIWGVREIKKPILLDGPIGWRKLPTLFHFAIFLIGDLETPLALEQNGRLTKRSLLKAINCIRAELWELQVTPQANHLDKEIFAAEVVKRPG